MGREQAVPDGVRPDEYKTCQTKGHYFSALSDDGMCMFCHWVDPTRVAAGLPTAQEADGDGL